MSTLSENVKKPIIWIPSLSALAIIIPATIWTYNHFAKTSEMAALECRTSIVVNELTQNVAKIESENEIKKLNRDIKRFQVIPVDQRTDEIRQDLEDAIDDKIFYKKLIKDIKVELKKISERQVKDPCKEIRDE